MRAHRSHLKWFGQGRPLASPSPPLVSFLSNYAMEGLPDRGSGDPTAEPDQLILHPPVPRGILRRDTVTSLRIAAGKPDQA
jgi:hypothetical protein